MNDAYSLIRGQHFALPKVDMTGARVRPDSKKEFVFGDVRRERRTKYEAVLPKIAELYEAGSSYREIAAGAGVPDGLVGGLITLLGDRGQLVRRPVRRKPKPTRPPRTRPMLKRLERDWDAMPLTPCGSAADGA